MKWHGTLEDYHLSHLSFQPDGTRSQIFLKECPWFHSFDFLREFKCSWSPKNAATALWNSWCIGTSSAQRLPQGATHLVSRSAASFLPHFWRASTARLPLETNWQLIEKRLTQIDSVWQVRYYDILIKPTIACHDEELPPFFGRELDFSNRHHSMDTGSVAAWLISGLRSSTISGPQKTSARRWLSTRPVSSWNSRTIRIQ